MTDDRYVLGEGRLPGWALDVVQAFRRMDGSTGFEYWYGPGRVAVLSPGDVIFVDALGRYGYDKRS